MDAVRLPPRRGIWPSLALAKSIAIQIASGARYIDRAIVATPFRLERNSAQNVLLTVYDDGGDRFVLAPRAVANAARNQLGALRTKLRG